MPFDPVNNSSQGMTASMGLLRPNCLLVQHRPHQSSQLKAGHIKFFETLIPEYPKQEATLTCLEDLVDSYENGRAPRGGPIEVAHNLTEACLAVARIGGETHRHHFVVGMVLVENSYQDIDVKQRRHASESKLFPELNDQLVRDHPTPS